MRHLETKFFLVLISLSLFCSQASADWQLNSNASSLYYVTSKASAVSEVNSFSGLSGNIDEKGNAVLNVALASVDTLIEVRNERVRDMLFEVENFPQATVTLNIDIESLEEMPAGFSVIGSYQVTINLHGISKVIDTELQVTKLNAKNVQVQLAMPLILSANDFGLETGIEALREIAGLPSINGNVVVGFTLLYSVGR